jgi:hypothetical protein
VKELVVAIRIPVRWGESGEMATAARAGQTERRGYAENADEAENGGYHSGV